MPQVPNAQELALHSLLPTVHSLPPELLQLSASLLAQSKSKAASLKPEEEIGRTYVCCHIACQRLGHKLALEVAKPSPPVKPKVYNKLHTYFNSVLATPKKAERRPEPKTKDVSTPTTKSPASTKTTPLKRQLSVPASTTPTKRTTRALQSSDATQSTENEQEYNPSNSEDLMDVDANVGLGLQDEIDQQLNTETSMYSKTPIRRKEKHAKPPVDGKEDTGPAGLLPGLGTMFQPAIDWLSDGRRAEYSEWRKGMDKDINSLESRSELTVR